MKKTIGQLAEYGRPTAWIAAFGFLALIAGLICVSKMKPKQPHGYYESVSQARTNGPHVSEIVITKIPEYKVHVQWKKVTIYHSGITPPSDKELKPVLREIVKVIDLPLEPPFEWEQAGTVVSAEESWRWICEIE